MPLVGIGAQIEFERARGYYGADQPLTRQGKLLRDIVALLDAIPYATGQLVPAVSCTATEPGPRLKKKTSAPSPELLGILSTDDFGMRHVCRQQCDCGGVCS